MKPRVAIKPSTGIGTYSDADAGAIYNSGNLTASNCVFWGDSLDEISNTGGTLIIEYSDVQGGWAGNGNIQSDPLFALSPRSRY